MTYVCIFAFNFIWIISENSSTSMSRNGLGNLGNSSSNSSTKKIKFNLNKSVRVTRIFIKEDHRLTKNDPIFTMVDANHPGSKKEPFLSSVLGTVTKLHIHEGDDLSHG